MTACGVRRVAQWLRGCVSAATRCMHPVCIGAIARHREHKLSSLKVVCAPLVAANLKHVAAELPLADVTELVDLPGELAVQLRWEWPCTAGECCFIAGPGSPTPPLHTTANEVCNSEVWGSMQQRAATFVGPVDATLPEHRWPACGHQQLDTKHTCILRDEGAQAAHEAAQGA